MSHNSKYYLKKIKPKEAKQTVWDPYTKFNINKLEKWQRRAARFVNGDYSRESSVTSMLSKPKWPPSSTKYFLFLIC
jgi:hypothetical protein